MRIFKPNKVGKPKPYIIIEMAQSHDGSIGMLHSMIDEISKLGVDAIKFQIHFSSEESSNQDKFRVKLNNSDKSRFDYWKRIEFSPEEWVQIINHCKKKKIDFLFSVFSNKAVDLANKLGTKAWKIASGELQSKFLINHILSISKKPILVSTGLSKWSEIHEIFNYLKKKRKIALFQCTSEYPTKTKNVGLNVIKELQNEFSCPVGLSDHTGEIYAPIAGIASGIDFLELHFTFSKRMFGPDSSSSLESSQISQIVKFRDKFNEMLDNPVNKNTIAKKLTKNRRFFGRSLALKHDKEKGYVIKRNDLTLKKPATGIDSSKIKLFIGKKLKIKKSAKDLLRLSDIE